MYGSKDTIDHLFIKFFGCLLHDVFSHQLQQLLKNISCNDHNSDHQKRHFTATGDNAIVDFQHVNTGTQCQQAQEH